MNLDDEFREIVDFLCDGLLNNKISLKKSDQKITRDRFERVLQEESFVYRNENLEIFLNIALVFNDMIKSKNKKPKVDLRIMPIYNKFILKTHVFNLKINYDDIEKVDFSNSILNHFFKIIAKCSNVRIFNEYDLETIEDIIVDLRDEYGEYRIARNYDREAYEILFKQKINLNVLTDSEKSYSIKFKNYINLFSLLDSLSKSFSSMGLNLIVNMGALSKNSLYLYIKEK